MPNSMLIESYVSRAAYACMLQLPESQRHFHIEHKVADADVNIRCTYLETTRYSEAVELARDPDVRNEDLVKTFERSFAAARKVIKFHSATCPQHLLRLLVRHFLSELVTIPFDFTVVTLKSPSSSLVMHLMWVLNFDIPLYPCLFCVLCRTLRNTPASTEYQLQGSLPHHAMTSSLGTLFEHSRINQIFDLYRSHRSSEC